MKNLNYLAVFFLFFSFLFSFNFAFAQKKVKQTYTVVGMGVPPEGMPAAKAKLMACRAAQVDGYRQLAEITKGVKVDAQTTVENFVVSSDVIKTKVKAVIQGARIVSKKQQSDGTCEVTMQLNLNKILEVMPPPVTSVPPPPKKEEIIPPTPKKKGTSFFGVHIKRGHWVPSANKHNDKGLEALSNGNYDTALTHFEEAVSIDNKFDIAWGNIGVTYEWKTEYQKAIPNFEKAISIDPKWSDHYVNLGHIYVDIGDYQTAKQKAEKALKLNSENEWAYLLLGRISYKKGDFNQAAKYYSKAVSYTYEDDPQLPQYYYFLGKAYLKAGNKQEAKKSFKLALKYKKDYWEAEEELRKI
jgi:Tfp pilus assembly protein PilF